MDVIPVLDVARGQVVRARAGDRARYTPIETSLATSSGPADVARALARLFAFRRYYIADLDGIEGRGRNGQLVHDISRVLPRAEIWLDAGTGSRGAARSVLAAPVTTLVIGSESLETAGEMADIVQEAPKRTVLSLDFRGDTFLGPDALLNDVSLWPDRVIVMTLSRVGGDEGPDLTRLADIIAKAGARKVYAAGGVRNVDDLAAIHASGAAGALIASALHDKKITADDLLRVTGR